MEPKYSFLSGDAQWTQRTCCFSLPLPGPLLEVRAAGIIVPVVFFLIFLLGTVGNGLVLAVLLRNGQVKYNTTNLFILNLAMADLCFIICCVPFQATIYTLDGWLFGPFACKAVHFLIYLTMYASSFTLAAVSVDRISESRKAKCKVTKMIVAVAIIFCLCWLPHHLVILCFWFGYFPFNRATYACRLASHCLSYANSCLNPIIYALISKHFRKKFKQVFTCLLFQNKMESISGNSESRSMLT
uniref:G-protein coupled receptors family 1 profile domain-containing protein n=1 Tax=Gopherus evgoodei TaxID=1825980 RepID=A0A8C4XW31_9SAUR